MTHSTRRSIQHFKISLLFLSLMAFFSCKQTGKQDSGHKYTNALIDETSPYLLQHAHNPVNWRPWSEEALETAKKENKLVLVSIGYSSCHWCHVMEEETFEDEEIAKMMNENFISIKVDREERPDVDQIYMTALLLMKGDGGWPLNVIVLPNGKPLYGGTYHTKSQWNKVLTEISGMYAEDPKRANEYADRVAAGIQEVNVVQPSDGFGALTRDALFTSVERWKTRWDPEWGGNREQQKFMLPINLDFLLNFSLLAEDKDASEHVRLSLDKMAMGGVYDQIGGGFYRYSTDSRWKVPHFEKMLYDNAQLISLYSKAYGLFKKTEYKQVVFETITFLEREMKYEDGGYYAAMDADSEGEEGKYYIWEEQELRGLLADDFPLFSNYFNIERQHVWENSSYILFKSQDDEHFAAENGISLSELQEYQKKWRTALLNARQKRIRPNIDDKIITSWNALLISAYVDAYRTFEDPVFLDRAKGIFNFIRAHSYKEGRLLHSYKKGGRPIDGFLEDYAFLIKASINLYGVALDAEYLDFANSLAKTVETHFTDSASGMYRYNSSNKLISKIVKTDDGVLPSPNAVMAQNLFQLGHLNYDTASMDRSKSMLSSMVPLLVENAPSYAQWNALLLNQVYPYYEIAVVGDRGTDLVASLHKQHIPNALVIGSLSESELPLFKGRYVPGETFIYVCRNSTCKLPVQTVAEAMDQLGSF
ncbi:thioredoxin domain-containing protein [Spongiimicrobium sp. 2-473A-2-J]|uniref:thioredoxin domain-containing protein n=1 Tax=Eudoraea algarum TaxID=3417568 RepID=UPI003D3673CC